MHPPSSKILVLGANGMIGHTVFRVLAESGEAAVVGTVRSSASADRLPTALQRHVVVGVDVEDADALIDLFTSVRPGVVINGVGVVKQLAAAHDPIAVLSLNALWPHRLARLCGLVGARLIQISTDCVFAGTRGHYCESDIADAHDLYGRTKYLGEVDYPHAVTLRTSGIGPELQSGHGLLAWFLAQDGRANGYRRAVFSGLPTVELARIIRDLVIPRPAMRGLYHVAARAINKYDLLTLVAQVYGKAIQIVPDDTLVVDRSLNAERFSAATGYAAPEWPALIERMHEFG